MSEALIAQSLSPRVEAAIARILGGDAGDFDGPVFSAVDWVNGAFPDEAACAGLDAAIERLDGEIAALDGSIRETVREQSCAGAGAGRDVAEAKDSIGDLAAKIGEIKRKADASEAMVQEICRDIRKLDVAKKNLTSTINVLARLKTLASAVEDLRANSTRRDYEKAAPIFEAAISMFAHFTEYRDMPKVSELATAVEKIRDELRYVGGKRSWEYCRVRALSRARAASAISEHIDLATSYPPHTSTHPHTHPHISSNQQ